jgi:hypothetical protein
MNRRSFLGWLGLSGAAVGTGGCIASLAAEPIAKSGLGKPVFSELAITPNEIREMRGMGIYCGTKNPNFLAGQGSLYLRVDGTLTESFVNVDGNANWVLTGGQNDV